jgi:hypothetical protein
MPQNTGRCEGRRKAACFLGREGDRQAVEVGRGGHTFVIGDHDAQIWAQRHRCGNVDRVKRSNMGRPQEAGLPKEWAIDFQQGNQLEKALGPRHPGDGLSLDGPQSLRPKQGG